MAEDGAQRTEQPTPRRLEKAREEGQIAASKELTAAAQFALAVGLLWMFGGEVAASLRAAAHGVIRAAFRPVLGMPELEDLGMALASDSLTFLWTFGASLLTVGLLFHMAQTQFALTTKRLTPDIKRLNPMQKLKELPVENLTQTLKAVLLLPLVGGVFYYVVSSELENFLTLPKMGLEAGMSTLADALLSLLGKAALALLALGLIDLIRQRRKIKKRLMMTKQEVKQEQKDIEGNPQIKARMRRMQREMMRKRMMSDVPEATVVVTNPTHFAVAIKYEPKTMAAPLVVAKGLDYLALRIRKVADEHGVSIVENPPLAQALYRGTDVGSEIPVDLYRAVAEILAYIYRLKGERPV